MAHTVPRAFCTNFKGAVERTVGSLIAEFRKEGKPAHRPGKTGDRWRNRKRQGKLSADYIGQILTFLIIGGVAGWLAGLILHGTGFGIVGNIVVGIIGALFGGWILKVLKINISIGIGGEWAGLIITATLGAVVLLLVINMVKPGKG